MLCAELGPGYLPRHNENNLVSEAVIARWTNERYEKCAQRRADMIGSLPNTMRALTIVPVSLHEEPLFNVERLMDLYGKQDMPADEWAVLLSLNYVGKCDESKAMDVMGTIDWARSRYPHLNIAACMIGYEDIQPISQIRSDIWDVAALDTFAKNITNDVIGISHDADMWNLVESHIRTWYELIKSNTNFCYGGYTSFATIGPEELPANRYLQFFNFLNATLVQCGHGLWFEHNMALSMNRYAGADSWGEAKVGEARTLLESVNLSRDGRPTDMSDLDSLLRWYKFSGAAEQAVIVSPRRVLCALLNEATAVRHHGHTFTTNQDDPARSKSNDEWLEIIKSEAIPLEIVQKAAAVASRATIDSLSRRGIETSGVCRIIQEEKERLGLAA